MKVAIAGLVMAICAGACVAPTDVSEDALGTESSAEALINNNTGPDREGDCVASTNPNGCIDCWAQRDEQCAECTGSSGDFYCCRLDGCEILNKPTLLKVPPLSGLKHYGSMSTQP